MASQCHHKILIMKPYLFLLGVLLISCAACKKVFLSAEAPNDPVNNFELFWHDFDQHYGLFLARSWNWDSIYQVYRPQVNSNTTEEELWTIFSNMIEYLDDSHTFIYNPVSKESYISGFALNNQAKLTISESLIQHTYITDLVKIPDSNEERDIFYYGKIKNKDIAYMYIGSMGNIDLENNEAFEQVIDEMVAQFNQHQAVILDVRNNTGGSSEIAARFAGIFAQERVLTITSQSRNGPNHDDFGPKYEYYTEPIGQSHFRKPIIVLTDRRTISAGEELVLSMKTIPDVTQIGDTTAGDFSDTSMRRFLLNGWQYQYSYQMWLLPDGTSPDGIGNVPDVYIKNSPTDIQNGTDKVLESAIQYLFEVYGIE